MALFEIVFSTYLVLSLVILVMNKFVSEFSYKMTLFYVDKLELSDYHYFKVDKKNKDSMFMFIRFFIIIMTLFMLVLSYRNLFLL